MARESNVSCQSSRTMIRNVPASVKIGPKLEQRLQTDFYKQVVGDPVNDAPEKLNHDEREAEQGNPQAPVTARDRIRPQEIVDNNLERPRLEKIQTDTAKREHETKNCLFPKGTIVSKGAPVDRHENLRLQVPDFRFNYGRGTLVHRQG